MKSGGLAHRDAVACNEERGIHPYVCCQNVLSPSPRPSPPGRGRSFRQSQDNHRKVVREGAAEWFTLSPRERAGVRAILSVFCVKRHECRAPFLLAALLSLVGAQCLAGVDTNAIPPLRPPRADLAPGYWEQHAAATIGVSVGVLALAGLLAWRLTRPKPPVLVPPEVLARRALEPLQARPEDGRLLSEVSQIMRRYVAAAFDLAPGEMTTTEFCRIIAASESVGPELASAMDTFMRCCDEKKFSAAPPAPVLNAARQGLVLVEQAEARRTELRRLEEAHKA